MLMHVPFHNARFNETRKKYFNSAETDLARIIQVPSTLDDSVFRCRIEYAEDIQKIEFFPYSPRMINTIKLVESNDIDYSYKYLDRVAIDKLFALRGSCDEILIVKNGLITDTSIANVVFTDGKKWHTPSTPLLNGTHRRRLLAEKKIEVKEIKLSDLNHYTFLRTINAMLDEAPLIPIDKIAL